MTLGRNGMQLSIYNVGKETKLIAALLTGMCCLSLDSCRSVYHCGESRGSCGYTFIKVISASSLSLISL